MGLWGPPPSQDRGRLELEENPGGASQPLGGVLTVSGLWGFMYGPEG